MESQKLDISVVCVARNECMSLKLCIESIVSHVREIIFLDHYSYDNTSNIAHELGKKYDNFKIVYPVNDNMSLADAKNLVKDNAKADIIYQFEADHILTNYELLESYVKLLQSNPTMIAVRYEYLNLEYDIYHYDKNIHHAQPNAEPHLFRKDAFVREITDQFMDAWTRKKPGEIYMGNSPTIHLNNVKPLLNLLYRCRMDEWAIEKSPLKYFEWLYQKHNGSLPDKDKHKEHIVASICGHIEYMLKTPKIMSTDKLLVCDVDFDLPQSIKDNELYKSIRIKQSGDAYYYDKTIILISDKHIVKYPSDNFKENLTEALNHIYDNNKLQ